MRRGGKREGAGRPPIDPRMVKIPVGYKLPRWLVEWLRGQDVPAAQLIEDALRRRYKLKPPDYESENAQSSQASVSQASASRSCSATVLDPCCGSRMMWFDRQNPNVIFGDLRRETLVVSDRSHGRMDGTRMLRIEPDVMLDFRALPYPDGVFRLVAFDPPHIKRAGPRSWQAAKYGKLSENWREDLRRGFAECFRVLEPGGVLVFKWNETHVKVREVLALTPERPLFGQVSGRGGLTHWLVFLKRTEA